MKTKHNFFTLIFLGCFGTSFGQNITIPDLNFKSELVKGYDTNGDGEISIQEAKNVVYIGNYHHKNITDLTGIEHFINLKTLGLNYNNLTTVDFSHNLKLEHLNISNNQLTSINLQNNTELKYLTVNYNQLTTINLSNNVKLEGLHVDNNKLSHLDVSNHTNLSVLVAINNQLTSINTANATSLMAIQGWNNKISQLDLTTNTNLQYLQVQDNLLTEIDVRNNRLEQLHAFNNPNLKNIFLIGNHNLYNSFTDFEVDIDNCPNLNFVCVNPVSFFNDIENYITSKYPQSTVSTDCNAIPTSNTFYTLFSLTPNPASDYIFLIRRHQREVITGNITIRTLSGQLVKTVAPNDQGKPSRSSNLSIDDVEQRIDIQDLSSNQQYIITVPIRDGVVSAIFLKN